MTLAATLLAGMARGCAFAHSPEAGHEGRALPDVAAQFRVERQDIGADAATICTWSMWRTADRLMQESDADDTTDMWQRDGRSLFHVRYFHAAKRGIEFQQEELSMLGAKPEWETLNTVVPFAVLQKLQVVAESGGSTPWRRYEGTIGAVQWSVTMRTDLMLPSSMERRDDRSIETLTLVDAWPIGQEPRQPRSTEGYRVLDFADLGDNERDPFVQSVQGQLGLGHDHGH